MLTRLDAGADPDHYDFDHPSSLDMESVYNCLKDLSEMRETYTPVYCFKTHARKPNEKKLIEPKRFVILEGILAFYDEVDSS